MSRVSTALALMALLAAGVAAAQSAPPEQSTATQGTAPSSESAKPNVESSASEHKAMVKDCVAQQRVNDPRMSEQAATKACEDRIGKSPH